MNDISIRRAAKADAKTIANLLVYAFKDDFSKLTKQLDRLVLCFEEDIHTDKFFVSVLDGRCVGFISCSDCYGRAVGVDVAKFQKQFGFVKGFAAGKAVKAEFCTPLPYPDTVGYIDLVAVDEDFRGRHIATKMLETVIRETPYLSYILDVTDINTGAQRCYQNFGFHEVGRKKVSLARMKGFKEKIYMEFIKGDTRDANTI